MKLKPRLGRSKTGLEDRSLWKRFRRNVSISVLGSGSSLAIKLAQTALLTKLLRIDDYGRLLIVMNLFVFLESFFGLRVSDLMFRFFPTLREQDDRRALKGLLLLCLMISLASGVLIYGSVVILSPWVADSFYPNLELAPLFSIYGCTLLVSSFSGVYEPILRVHDNFASIVVPQVLGSLLTFMLLCVYFVHLDRGFSTPGNYNLKMIVAAFAVGALVQSVPPLLKALSLLRPFLTNVKAKEAFQALRGHRKDLVGCLVNSNFSGYLKFAVSPGDIFLLGIFSTPTQLALYGLAKQLTSPIALLQTNIQTAVTPEITLLVAKRKFAQLRSLLARYIRSSVILGSFLLLMALLMGRFLILMISEPEYLAALPVFYVLVIAAWLMMIFLVFRPLALNLDLLKWHNLTLLTSTAVLMVFVVLGKLNAMTMALIQLGEALILRSVFSAVVWTRLKRLR